MRRSRLFCGGSVVVAVFVSSILALAQTSQSTKLPARSIKNFGRINDNYYRGAQPKKEDFSELAALGIKTVIDLQQEGMQEEQKIVESLNMKFFRIPLTTKKKPRPQDVEAFLKIVDDPANQPVFVHCRGGRHRTGIMTAAYRLTHDGWDANRAYSEMKAFEFEKGFVSHNALREFVYEYEQSAAVEAARGQSAGQGGSSNR